ncbi:arginine--tRNA ligase [Sedimentibacter hydroxybenzoicus DSM 7310]|uniref:Arginine--tRNA ligase n=2 Tax=Sedimentibacter hydroxybenzoicus TaxID=29345 RepID=A0A974GY76_SEDHY|nr:arginine--tRNA ligase [Sedimentibacter hydroxybenzoicus]NYB75910.1 arginine--tRNA ligase [Sedimentibacter hydroxybenzoicus DSM 7310]
MDFKERVAEIFTSIETDLSLEDALLLIETPPSPDMGDFAVPCFKFAKKYRKSPTAIAAELTEKIGNVEEFEKIESMGPYVNFFVDKKHYAEKILKTAFKEKEGYGSTNVGEGKSVIVEFSSPNIAKPFHIGHIRTTIIGNSIYKIYKYLGYNTITINHLGDYGTQFGMLISAYKKWGSPEIVEAIEKNPIQELLKLYVKYNQEMEEHPEYKDEARYWFKELENGNEEAIKLWTWFREVSLMEFNRVYDMLNIKFDSYAGESFYSDKMPAVMKELEEKGLLKDSQGAKIVELQEFGLTDAVVQKSDGSTLYVTRDIAAAKYRKETYDFYKNIYVVGAPQKLHFEQWRKIINLMGYEWSDDCVHVMFGTVSLEDGVLSTRKGRVVFLEDVLNKAIEKTTEIINDRNTDLENKEEVAKQVGIGAVIFQELFNNRIKDYTFSWEKTLSFEGETGPYVQYTYARTCSILRKAEQEVNDNVDYSILTDKEAFNVIKKLDGFKSSVLGAHDKYEPFFITRYIVGLAQEFNRFYHECPIIVEDKEIKKARLLLTKTVNTVLKKGMELLGMEAPERM